MAGRKQETRADAHLRPEVIGGRERDRLAAKGARRAERAAAIKHQQETRVVVHRRDEPAAAHFEARRSAHVDEFYRRPGIGVLRERLGEPLVLVGGCEEAGSLMPSGVKRRSRRNAPRVWPDMTSMMRPMTSVEAVMPGHACLLKERELGVRRWEDRGTTAPRHRDAARPIRR